jgi:DNA-binding response OmpR family regulator
MQARILCIERKRSESPSYVAGLRKKGFDVETVSTGADAIKRLTINPPHLVIVNAASLRTNGKRICKSLRNIVESIAIVVILDSQQVFDEDDECQNVILRLPFTARKLVNRIIPFLKGNPSSILKTGQIQLDMERKTVRIQDRETRLTPRLTTLLRMLMEHAGEAIPRDQLFTTVWKTQYTGDTRTLDVHISWLRQAIEVDPKHPVLLKTVRGLGYRLDA